MKELTLTPVPEVRTHAAYLRFAINMAAEHCNGTVCSYSGRYMYGARCVGVEVNNPVLFAGLVGVFTAWNEDVDVSNAALTGMCWDEMGKDFVVYWPDLELTSDLEG